MNILFLCTYNRWRSPTAESLWRNVEGVSARSAGTGKSARRRVTQADLHWADMVLVMEEKHKSRLLREFRDQISGKMIHVLDIPNDYQLMDPELIEILLAKTEPLVLGNDET